MYGLCTFMSRLTSGICENSRIMNEYTNKEPMTKCIVEFSTRNERASNMHDRYHCQTSVMGNVNACSCDRKHRRTIMRRHVYIHSLHILQILQ